MGLFDTIKKNFKRGGIKVTLSAPLAAQVTDRAIPITVTITASEPQTINGVTVMLLRSSIESRSENRISIGSSSDSSSDLRVETLITASISPAFQIAAGEIKTIQTDFVLNPNAAPTQDYPETAAEPGGLMGAVKGLADLVSSRSYEYKLAVKADVEGIALDPTASSKINM